MSALTVRNVLADSAANSTAARLPGLQVPSTGSAELDAFLAAVAEHLEVRQGARGNPYERAVTVRDLEHLGLATGSGGGLGGGFASVDGGILVAAPGGGYLRMGVEEFAEQLRGTALYQQLIRSTDDSTRFDDLPARVRELLRPSLDEIAAVRGADVRRFEEQLQTLEQSFAASVQEVTASVAGATAAARSVEFGEATLTRVVAGTVRQIRAQIEGMEGDGVTIEQVDTAIADATTGLYAESYLKLNAGGAIASIGLSASRDPTGAKDSALIFQADRVAFIGANDTIPDPKNPPANRVPFGIDTTTNTLYLNGNVRINAGGLALQQLGRGLQLTASQRTIRYSAAGVATPASVTFTATATGDLTGNVTFAIASGTGSLTAGTGGTCSLAAANMASDSIVILARVTMEGVNYDAYADVTKVRDGASGTNGTNGTNGSSTQVEYSPTGAGETWHPAFAANDTFMRQRVGTGAWSDPIRIVGEAGANGATGNYTDYVFQRAASQPATPTTAAASGWSGAPPAANGSKLWMTKAVKTAAGALAGAWSAPIQLEGENGTNGRNGYDGANGSRGSGNFYASGSSWNDSIAQQAVISATGTFMVVHDTVTISSGSFAATKYWSGSGWIDPGVTINGNLIASGTISASTISGGRLTGVTLEIGNFSSYYGGRAFQVSSTGITYIDYLYAGTIQGNNYSAPGQPAIYGASLPSGTNVGVFATVAYGNYSSAAHAIQGRHYRSGAGGIIGGAMGYDFYADGDGVNFGPFTGSHDALVPKGTVLALGDIVVDVAVLARRSFSNTITEVATSSRPRQPGAIGVVVKLPASMDDGVPAALCEADFVSIGPDGKEVVTRNYSREYATLRWSHDAIVVNALGEGQVNVCGEGGDLAPGDLICTSGTPGKGMRQADDLVRGYTVAKCRERVAFDSPGQVRTVACIYLAG